MMLIKNCKGKIKVGDLVRTNGSTMGIAGQKFFKGEIGEIKPNTFFVWQDKWDGGKGNLSPNTKGYKFSWAIDFRNGKGEIEIIKTTKRKVGRPPKKKKVEIKKINIRLKRDNDAFGLHIKIPKEMEKFFSGLSKGKTQKSGSWKYKDGKGAEFYQITKDYEKLEKEINHTRQTTNEYGHGLLKNGHIVNLAPLRSVGASKGIHIFCDRFANISNMDFKFYIEELGKCAKDLWAGVIANKEVKAEITFEI